MENKVSKLSIRANMILNIVLYVLMPLFLSLIILSVLLQRNLSSGTRESYQLMFNQKVEKVDNAIEIAIYASSALMVFDDDIALLRTMYDGENEYVRNRAQTRLAKVMKKNSISILGSFSGEMMLLSNNGKLITSSSVNQPTMAYQEKEWYHKIMKGGQFPYWDSQINELLGGKESIDQYMVFGRAIQKYEGRQLGALFVRIPRTIFWDNTVDSGFRQGSMVMLSPDHRLLTQSDDSYDSSVINGIMEDINTDTLKWDTNVSGRYGSDYYYMAARLNSCGNILLYIGDYDYIFSKSERIGNIIIGFMIMITVGVMWIVVRVSNYITQPINKLVKNMQYIERSNSPPSLGEHNFQETQELERSFIRAQKRIQVLLEDVKEETEQKEKAYYEALQAQINPHFLFNTLNAIRWKAALNEELEVADMLSDLSVLLYETYDSNQQELGTISHAMVVLDAYVKIMKVRFSDKVSFFHMIPEELGQCLIPRFCLQPLVENSFLHGMTHVEEGLIVLRAEQVGDDIELTLTDNGRNAEKKTLDSILKEDQESGRHKITGIGLSNIHKRVQSLFGGEYGLRIDDTVEIGFRIILKVPKREEEKYGTNFDSGR